VCYSTPTVYAYEPNFVLIGLFCHPLVAKTPNFCHFWTSAFTGVASWQQSEKVEHGCTTTNLLLSNDIKTVSVLQHLHGEIGHTISDVQKRNGQTDKQTDGAGRLYSTFWSNLSKNFSLGVLYPNLCTNGVKFGMELHAKFHPHRCNVSPLRGKKTSKSASE